ncbi:hypothetical protein SAY87_019664 [Trapa incisa]|uniref:Trichome birefringence-like N-terminal domain-containing protein n=2 Tax=Trapa TaxID=22665 RepID=A0AAN7LUY7_TRANT|nr:hypothetical protein SAY87_019664 [Trapa incisa]KAK4792975.1 hypothetical protein SAY86_023410 [Trapa natans]
MKLRAGGGHELLPFGKPPKVVLLVTFSFILLTLISVCHPFKYWQPINYHKASSSSPSSSTVSRVAVSDGGGSDVSVAGSVVGAAGAEAKECDIFSGEWVPNHRAPYYTNETCWAIHEHQNCMKYGRPDTGFMKWRWKPFGCELPLFNPAQFLELVRGKSLALVGDSVARNQMQSLICLLSKVEYPVDASYTSDEHFKRWKYQTYNFTLAIFTSPHLVKTKEADSDGPTHTGLFNLYLDEVDDQWSAHIDGFDYVIISAGHWFFRPLVFYENHRPVGCHFCNVPTLPDLTKFYGFRKAFRSAFAAINHRKGYKGITYLRTFAPGHFEGGLWNQGGNCLKTTPYRSNETALGGDDMELYLIQIEEFRRAEAEGRKRGLKYRLLDTTQAMLLRPDGHPSRYGHRAEEKVVLYNDCVHWCLPGPIDAWGDFLLEMLKTEGRRSREEKKLSSSGRRLG